MPQRKRVTKSFRCKVAELCAGRISCWTPAQAVEDRAPVITPIQPRMALGVQGAKARMLAAVDERP
jgi:hypothetical protein